MDGGLADYDYDSLDRLTTLTDQWGGASVYGYAASGDPGPRYEHASTFFDPPACMNF